MKLKRVAFLFLSVALFAGLARAFELSQPEAEGVSSDAILGWVESVERDVDALHGFVLVRHGKIVAEGWWAPYE